MQLSNSSRQVLLSMVKDEITQLEDFIRDVKIENRYYYEKADVNDPEGTDYYFKSLNHFRNIIREAKKRVKKLAQVAKELKSELRGDSVRPKTIQLNISDIVLVTDKIDIK
jgi:DNA-directed RNA polymerase specialized sigma54-like protein